MLIQKMAVNVDLGFILSLVEFFALNGSDPLFQVCTCILNVVYEKNLQCQYSCWCDLHFHFVIHNYRLSMSKVILSTWESLLRKL